MEFISKGLMAILSFLPDSPFKLLDRLDPSGVIAEILGFVNWFVPIYTFVGIFEGWLVCVALYYVYQIGLRWLKAIE